MMTFIPKRAVAQMQSNFWILLVGVMDNFPGARKFAPVCYHFYQRTKRWWWALAALLIAAAGTAAGFLVGLALAA